MRKLVLSTILVAAFGYAQAQSQGDFRASVGVAMGTKTSVDTDNGDDKAGVGINVGVEYFIIESLSIAPSYSYYFPATADGIKFNTSVLNVDARYYFGTSFYALAGYASYANTLSFDGSPDITVSEGAYNVGAGAMIPAGDSMNINVQVKYNAILDSAFDFNQIMAQAGVAFAF